VGGPDCKKIYFGSRSGHIDCGSELQAYCPRAGYFPVWPDQSINILSEHLC